MMTMQRRLGALLLAGFLAACGGDDDGDDGTGDDDGDDGTGAVDAGEVDSGSTEPDAGVVIECPDGDLGAVGELQNQTTLQLPIDAKQPDGPQQRFLFGEFGTEDTFALTFFDGRGAFTDGAAPGTYALGGEETSLSTCGICMRFCIITDQAEFTLAPTSGELVVDEVVNRIAGSATDMVLQQISLETGELLEGGCTASATGVSFDAALVPPL